MKNILESTKDFKIIPDNFKSAGEFKILSINEEEFKVQLTLTDKSELDDYKVGNNVEIFGVNDFGLIYFETTIIGKNDFVLTLSISQDYSVIQRREYSRVKLNQGQLIFNDMAENIVDSVEDISAGGIKFISNEQLSIDKTYDVKVILSNNMTINCGLQPVRITNNDNKYVVSARFNNLENVDRVVLVQYAFKIKMEEQSKGN